METPKYDRWSEQRMASRMLIVYTVVILGGILLFVLAGNLFHLHLASWHLHFFNFHSYLR